MRILYVTNGFPYPLTSGYLRHYFLLRELARHHEITLFSIVGPTFRAEHKEALRPFTKSVLTFGSTTRRHSIARKLRDRSLSFLGACPEVREMRETLAGLAIRESFDVMFSGKRTLAALRPLDGVPLVADMCDATSSRILRSVAFAEPARLPLLLLEYAQTRRAERMLMRRAAHSIFISCRDREDILGTEANGTSIVPNGVDADFWKRSGKALGRDTIAFTGAMNYRPNTDAALFLIERVMPLVRREIAGARLLVIGRDPTSELVSANGKDGVEVTGSVDDVRAYLERATVFGAPIRFGAGIQNKVLEAMAMELPVVASPLAADGLRTEEGRRPPVALASSPEEFAAALIRVLRAKSADPTPDRSARAYVRENFVWQLCGAKLDEVLRTACGKELACSLSL